MHVIIILAAGGSARLGRPKQLLQHNGKTLLQHAIHEALATGCPAVIVVLGAHADTIQPGIEHECVCIARNQSWERGIGTSIRTGMNALRELQPDAESALFMLCDQPFADQYLLQQLIAGKRESGKGIAASAYGDTLGVPALFDRHYFNELCALDDDEGAKILLKEYSNDVASVEFPGGITDIDTAADCEWLNDEQMNQ